MIISRDNTTIGLSAIIQITPPQESQHKLHHQVYDSTNNTTRGMSTYYVLPPPVFTYLVSRGRLGNTMQLEGKPTKKVIIWHTNTGKSSQEDSQLYNSTLFPSFKVKSKWHLSRLDFKDLFWEHGFASNSWKWEILVNIWFLGSDKVEYEIKCKLQLCNYKKRMAECYPKL